MQCLQQCSFYFAFHSTSKYVLYIREPARTQGHNGDNTGTMSDFQGDTDDSSTKQVCEPLSHLEEVRGTSTPDSVRTYPGRAGVQAIMYGCMPACLCKEILTLFLVNKFGEEKPLRFMYLPEIFFSLKQGKSDREVQYSHYSRHFSRLRHQSPTVIPTNSFYMFPSWFTKAFLKHKIYLHTNRVYKKVTVILIVIPTPISSTVRLVTPFSEPNTDRHSRKQDATKVVSANMSVLISTI